MGQKIVRSAEALEENEWSQRLCASFTIKESILEGQSRGTREAVEKSQVE